MIGISARLVLQLGWVILVARVLGVDGYGLFAGLVALAMAMSGVVGLGLGLRLYQDVARNPKIYSARWDQLRRALVLSAIVVSVIFLLIASFQFTNNWELLCAIALSELVFAPVVAQIAFVFSAHGRVGFAAFAPVVLSAARLVAILLFYLADYDSVANYAIWHATASGVAIGLLFSVQRRLIPPDRSRHPLTSADIREGLPFCAVGTSSLALGSVDKALALRMGGADLAGHYSAAFRFVALVATPADALVTAAMPRLFQRGRDGAMHRRLLGALTLTVGLYGAAGAVVVWCFSGLLPRVLGREFVEAAAAAKLLAIYAPIYCLRSLGVHVLLGQGERWWRFFGETVATIVIAAIAILAVPVLGMTGIVTALVAGETFLLMWVWIKVFMIESGLRRLKDD